MRSDTDSRVMAVGVACGARHARAIFLRFWLGANGSGKHPTLCSKSLSHPRKGSVFNLRDVMVCGAPQGLGHRGHACAPRPTSCAAAFFINTAHNAVG